MPTGGRSTLTQFLIEERRRAPGATGDLNGLITAVSLACKAISRKVAYGGLAGVLGSAGTGNVQGEEQQTLDVLSNQMFLRANEWGGHVAGMVSEELEQAYTLPPQYPRGKYLLLFDPLDGSSNVDVNVTVGSIFSIIRAVTAGQDARPQDFLQPGTE
ncbi:MAG TPA: class 1 fructose-bisphosphatase, partial [Caldimonas sp.]